MIHCYIAQLCFNVSILTSIYTFIIMYHMLFLKRTCSMREPTTRSQKLCQWPNAVCLPIPTLHEHILCPAVSAIQFHSLVCFRTPYALDIRIWYALTTYNITSVYYAHRIRAFCICMWYTWYVIHLTCATLDRSQLVCNYVVYLAFMSVLNYVNTHIQSYILS